MTAVAYDLYQAAAPRIRHLAVMESSVYDDDDDAGEPVGVYLPDLFRQGWFEPECYHNEEIYELWQSVALSVRQAEAMMALANTAERADAILKQHQQGLVELYDDLKRELKKTGICFAQEG